ncbi:hypothetical protein [Orrella daihaiensis]|uniref:Uncharacterized protein n=1 Tax=Orrella daihaiensis TaxID=2782176 RepID=A0ABY4AN01_9BURK|nr:hypothetical protein [Orrella daihaiensis]UOD51413.1 hypothetical protein DHf2319_06200 [Orrella daihaiensis]
MDSSQPAIEVSSKIAYLQPGMYIIRLASEAPGNVITLNPTPVGRGTVDFFPGDGVVRNTLAKVGDCVIVRVKAAVGSLLLTEFHKAGQQQQMKLKIDRVATEGFEAGGGAQTAFPSTVRGAAGRDTGTAAAPTAAPTAAPAAATELPVRQLGHIEGVGDTIVENDWLGDPDGDARIEGFAVNVKGLPAGVSLNYGALIEGTRRYAAAVAGQFVGTRQKAKSLLGVVFDLTGPGAEQFQLSGEVVFAGEPPLAIEPGVQLSGPSGTEHLVALQLSITPLATRSTAASAWDDPAVTRIVRQSPTVAHKAPVKPAAAKKAAAKKVSTRRK